MAIGRLEVTVGTDVDERALMVVERMVVVLVMATGVECWRGGQWARPWQA
jgi:hypothetical protein